MRVNACPRQGYGGSLIKRILEDSFTETVCTACARAVGTEGQLKVRAVPVESWVKDAMADIKRIRRNRSHGYRRGARRLKAGLLKQSSSWASVSFVLVFGYTLMVVCEGLQHFPGLFREPPCMSFAKAAYTASSPCGFSRYVR